MKLLQLGWRLLLYSPAMVMEHDHIITKNNIETIRRRISLQVTITAPFPQAVHGQQKMLKITALLGFQDLVLASSTGRL